MFEYNYSYNINNINYRKLIKRNLLQELLEILKNLWNKRENQKSKKKHYIK